MTEVRTSKTMPGSTRLWRYMALDKLVDLLSSGELHFSPLAAFMKTDPYEGNLPSVALDAHVSIVQKYVEDVEQSHGHVATIRANRGFPLTAEETAKLRASVDDLRTSLRRLMPAIAKATTVNCWYASDTESEAMWRLYAENGKAVAIETTLDGLKESICLRDYPAIVHIYPVKYLDFFDSALQPKDCLVEGHSAPLLKRIAYQHEREVRAFTSKRSSDPLRMTDVNYWQPTPMRLPVDVKTLVKSVHISPYATQPFPRSVVKLCELFGLEPTVVRPSKLLSGHEELLDRLTLQSR